MNKTKAFSYLRVSSKIQIEGDGFPRQRETINRHTSVRDIEVVQEFVEGGVSGTKEAFDRPALGELLAAIKDSDVRLVLVERADRLARDNMVSEILLDQFRKLGVKVVSAECGTDLTVTDGDPTKKLIRQILGIFAEYEKSVLVAKLRAARVRMKRETGRCEGQKPYGSRPGEKEVIQRIKDLKLTGHSVETIAGVLNVDGIKPRHALRAGKETKWHPTAVLRILKANS